MSDYYVPELSCGTAVAVSPSAWGFGVAMIDVMVRQVESTDTEIRALPGLVLKRPIAFQVERISGEFVLTDEVFNRYGSSCDFAAARDELKSSLADYFDTLLEEERRLSCGAREHYEAMLRHVDV